MMRRLVFPVLVAVLLISCSANSAGTAQPTAPSSWKDIPIMPDAVVSNESMPVTGYQYMISTDMKSVEDFYVNQMKAAQWELLGKGDTNTQDFKGLALWFAKGEKVVTISVGQKNNTTRVAIVPEP